MLSQKIGEPVDPRRFRANLLIDTETTEYIEDDWVDRTIKIGPSVILRIIAPLPRCVMLNNSQEDLQQDSRVLQSLASYNSAKFSVWAKVECSGEVKDGDETILG